MCIWAVSKLVAVPVSWFPREVGSVCDKCTEGRVLLQYATNSSSPRPCAPSGHWSPREAEGTVQYYILYLVVVRFHHSQRCHCMVVVGLQIGQMWLKCTLSDAYHNKSICFLPHPSLCTESVFSQFH